MVSICKTVGPDFGQVRIEFDAAPCGERTGRPDREAGQVFRPAGETRLTASSKACLAGAISFAFPFAPALLLETVLVPPCFS